MSVIALEGMRFYAHHGVYDEERILGGEYIVDVYITAGTSRAAESDELAYTINYETVYAICKYEMEKPSKLIENVIERITIGIKHQFQIVGALKIKIHKLNPPLGGRVDKATVEDSSSFMSQCGRCGRGMVCYGDETCWCNESKTIHPRTVEMVSAEHGSCVCNSCIDFFAG